MESMPTFSDKDLQVVRRKTEKGVWKHELWTQRDFEALELQLAPVSSQLKDSNLMATGHAVVGLPKHGRGSHPDNTSLARIDNPEVGGSILAEWVDGRIGEN